MKKPEGFENNLSDYGPQIFDPNCGEPVGWGFMITERVEGDRWNELSSHGKMECLFPKWYLITKRLTKEEAENSYGPISNLEVGTRGVFKSVTFGDKKFTYRIQGLDALIESQNP